MYTLVLLHVPILQTKVSMHALCANSGNRRIFEQGACSIVILQGGLDVALGRGLDHHRTTFVAPMRVATGSHACHVIAANNLFTGCFASWTSLPAFGLHLGLQFVRAIARVIDQPQFDLLVALLAKDEVAIREWTCYSVHLVIIFAKNVHRALALAAFHSNRECRHLHVAPNREAFLRQARVLDECMGQKT